MQAPIQSEQLQETQNWVPGDAVAPQSAIPLVAPGVSPDLVYDLRLKDGSSGRYYEELGRFSDKLLAEIELRAGPALGAYSRYVLHDMNEAPRSRGEYGIELLTLGLALRRYRVSADLTPAWVFLLARQLFRLRRRSTLLKPAADCARSVIVSLFMLPKTGHDPRQSRPLADGLPRLIDWLQATGEFEQEVVRLNNWLGFLATLPRAEAAHWVKAALALFDWFQGQADRVLGPYTRGVPGFLTGEYARRGCREDQVFCAKQPVEYHLNMVAAEIMNRGLREQFERTRLKAVLVPACMRGAQAATCKARASGVDLTCTACDPACAVNRISRKMRGLGAKVYLVPHSTGFSRWLERWQRQPDTGVAAVACLLNILPGGYEMRARGIASQCVPLDYPGCAKHWRRKAIATGLNEDRLVQIVAGNHP
jgi:hypothetical protein